MPTYDSQYKRATFGTMYPSDDTIFEQGGKKEKFDNIIEKLGPGHEKRRLKAKRLTFNIDNFTFRKIIFEENNFHDAHGNSIPIISQITFEDCDFKKCFMGSVKYRRVVFRNCTFTLCDFMNSDFIECVFTNCSFEQCSAYYSRFKSTEISPIKFLLGIIEPTYNFNGLAEDEIIKIKRGWIRTRLFLTQQFILSNNDLSIGQYVDEGIYLNKKEQIKLYKDKLKYGIDITNIDPKNSNLNFKDKIYSRIIVWLKQINIFISDGGTNLGKLILTFTIIVLLSSILLNFISVSYQGESLMRFESEWSISNTLYGILANIPSSLSLFLGYGYSAFSATSAFSYLFLNVIAMLGLVWYALMISILLRRIRI